jgi:hypothetical protein
VFPLPARHFSRYFLILHSAEFKTGLIESTCSRKLVCEIVRIF